MELGKRPVELYLLSLREQARFSRELSAIINASSLNTFSFLVEHASVLIGLATNWIITAKVTIARASPTE